MIEVANLGVFTNLFFHLFDLSHEGSPEASVLDSLNLDYIGVRERLLELSLNLLELGALLVELDNHAELL